MKPVLLTPARLKKWLWPRAEDAHKGDFGHVLVVAGSRDMSGAARLCAAGALRSGAGLVTLAVPKGIQSVVARLGRWEVLSLPLPETPDGSFHRRAVQPILEYLRTRRVTALAVGPGMTVTPHTQRLVEKILSNVSLPVVLDADGLNALAAQKMRRGSAPLILTPHPGELARLTDRPTPRTALGRAERALETARRLHAVCVLKGQRTVITDGQEVYINPTGNPGMATGGSGDVLCGMIAALTAQVQGFSLREKTMRAACVAVYVHGLAGDLAVRPRTRIGLTAGDLLEFLPAAFRRIFGQGI